MRLQIYAHTVIFSGKSVYLLRQICDYIKDSQHTSCKHVFILSFFLPEKQIYDSILFVGACVSYARKFHFFFFTEQHDIKKTSKDTVLKHTI
jgi:hypothetical protein